MPLPGSLDLPDPRNTDARLGVAVALDLLAAYGESSSVEGERLAAEERTEAEAAAEEHRQAAEQFRQSGLHAH